MQLHGLQASAAQAEASAADSKSQASTQASAELATSENAVSELRQQLKAEQAEVLTLKGGQGAINKAVDVIRALESQVHMLVTTPDSQSLLALMLSIHTHLPIHHSVKSSVTSHVTSVQAEGLPS